MADFLDSGGAQCSGALVKDFSNEKCETLEYDPLEDEAVQLEVDLVPNIVPVTAGHRDHIVEFDAADPDAIAIRGGADSRDGAEGDRSYLVRTGDTLKRRRCAYFISDDVTEIPNETYQGYMHDCGAITRSDVMDYTILLPHYALSFPNYTTTFTDLCKPLADGILWGAEIVDKRRRLQSKSKLTGQPVDFGACGAFGRHGLADIGPLSPFLSPVHDSGLRSTCAPEPAAPTTPMHSSLGICRLPATLREAQMADNMYCGMPLAY